MTTPEQIAFNWLSAFNAKQLENLLDLYDEHAEHFSPKLAQRLPETKGLINEKASLRDWWADAFDRLPSLHYKVLTITANENRVFMEYLRQVDGEPEMKVAEVLEIRNEKIVFSRVYHGS